MNMVNKFREKYLVPPWIDYHTVEHIMRGAIIAFIGQFYLPLLLTMGIVAGVSIIHEIIQWTISGWQPYGSKSNWRKNTAGDLIFEIGIGILVAL